MNRAIAVNNPGTDDTSCSFTTIWPEHMWEQGRSIVCRQWPRSARTLEKGDDLAKISQTHRNDGSHPLKQEKFFFHTFDKILLFTK